MSWYSRSWAPYVSVEQRQRNAAREVSRLRKAGQTIAPVQIAGRGIATTVWGNAWCDNLESYHDYENRLPRGRTYVRNGSVIDLQIAPRVVQALVSGSDIYRVMVTIASVPKAAWRSICTDCTGKIDSLIELLQGRLSKAVMERLCRQNQGLFPKPSEIRFSCSCPDHALMCKHVAAVLYGIGARLDTKPDLLFRLRDVDATDLIANIGTALPVSTNKPTTDRMLGDNDVAALFGIDMGAAQASNAEKPEAKKPKPDARKRTTSRATSKNPSIKATKIPRAKAIKTQARHSSPDKSTTKIKTPQPAADKPIKWWLKPKSSINSRSQRPAKRSAG